MNRKWMDLHLHTLASDGSMTATELVQKAKACGLDALAVTDHDSVEALGEARAVGERLGIEIISGIELSAYDEKVEIHILGYFFDDANPEFLRKLEALRRTRDERIHKIVEKLRALKIDVTADEVFKLAGHGAVGRLHVARVLVQKGVVANTDQAFKKYLANGRPAHAPKEHLSSSEAIQLLVSVGGVPVLAHPGLMHRDDLITRMVQEGLKGLEVYHSKHSEAVSRHYEDMAKACGLAMTGGSDCHGTAKGQVLVGTVKVPYALLEPLKKASPFVHFK